MDCVLSPAYAGGSLILIDSLLVGAYHELYKGAVAGFVSMHSFILTSLSILY